MANELEQKLKLVRDVNRITGQKIIQQLFHQVLELHGDRINHDDPALFSGIALFENQPVTILSVDRGTSLTERIEKNGGAVRASGYRKALRSVELAEKFHRPVIIFLNMPGADASLESENEGQSLMIAKMIAKMGQLKVPNLAVFIGEGHSGGALAFANANRIVMFENGLFSVASPEAMSAILRKETVSEVVPMTAAKLQKMGLVDQIIREDQDMICQVKTAIKIWLDDFNNLSSNELIKQRTEKFAHVLAYWDKMD
ncbi:carboxyltransferase subunit alpha [Pediococcus argentinicus]|uniref:carboxyltransferase subunit alpha n=1 Tax=Pediococcus argentinicus TaxID=480391 RepID=UPI00338FD759